MSVKVLGHFGGYRKMFSFGWTCLIYHTTTLFCRRNYNYRNDALGKPMRKMICRKGRNAGNAFWSCTGYPECRGTRVYP